MVGRHEIAAASEKRLRLRSDCKIKQYAYGTNLFIELMWFIKTGLIAVKCAESLVNRAKVFYDCSFVSTDWVVGLPDW